MKQYLLNLIIIVLFICGLTAADISGAEFNIFSKEALMVILAFIMSFINNMDI